MPCTKRLDIIWSMENYPIETDDAFTVVAVHAALDIRREDIVCLYSKSGKSDFTCKNTERHTAHTIVS